MFYGLISVFWRGFASDFSSSISGAFSPVFSASTTGSPDSDSTGLDGCVSSKFPYFSSSSSGTIAGATSTTGSVTPTGLGERGGDYGGVAPSSSFFFSSPSNTIF